MFYSILKLAIAFQVSLSSKSLTSSVATLNCRNQSCAPVVDSKITTDITLRTNDFTINAAHSCVCETSAQYGARAKSTHLSGDVVRERFPAVHRVGRSLGDDDLARITRTAHMLSTLQVSVLAPRGRLLKGTHGFAIVTAVVRKGVVNENGGGVIKSIRTYVEICQGHEIFAYRRQMRIEHRLSQSPRHLVSERKHIYKCFHVIVFETPVEMFAGGAAVPHGRHIAGLQFYHSEIASTFIYLVDTRLGSGTPSYAARSPSAWPWQLHRKHAAQRGPRPDQGRCGTAA